MKTTRKQTDYFEVVNVNGSEIEMLDYIFVDGTFKGATGTRFDVISKGEYKERMSKESVIDYILDCGLIAEGTPKNLERKLAEVYYKEMKANDEIEQFIFDLSYIEHWDKLRKYGFPKSKYPIFNCSGGGRMFDKKSTFNTNKHLEKLVREVEA